MTMMVGGLKAVVVKEGREQEFETLFAALRAEIAAHEPGCVYYSLLKSRTDPRAYIVEEQYRDEAAWEAHQASAYGKTYFPKMRAIIDDITVEYFDVIVA
ncbi:MAG TPA: putative quinol monooxygenase [Rhizomicrobium sp.]|nr:putative quinol monooxygenase [Rhizomicrobium sp.]